MMGEQAVATGYSAQQSSKLFLVGENQMANDVIGYFLTSKMGVNCEKWSWDSLKANGDDTELLGLKAVLVDFDTSGIKSRETEELKGFIAKFSEVPVIIFNFSPDERIKKWVTMGVRGFLYNSDPCNNMLKAVKMVIEGKLWIPRQALSLGMNELNEMRVSSQSQAYCLTKREKEILSKVAAGNTNSDIAEKLFISPHTVKVHIQNIFKKIGVPNRVKATLWAHHHNMDFSF
jgi:LuxR family transcriptional regulator of csgAB operon